MNEKRQLIFPVEIKPVSDKRLVDLIKLAIKIAKAAQTFVTFSWNEDKRYFIGPEAKFEKNNLEKFRIK